MAESGWIFARSVCVYIQVPLLSFIPGKPSWYRTNLSVDELRSEARGGKPVPQNRKHDGARTAPVNQMPSPNDWMGNEMDKLSKSQGFDTQMSGQGQMVQRFLVPCGHGSVQNNTTIIIVSQRSGVLQ
jgi:hypothetical protein